MKKSVLLLSLFICSCSAANHLERKPEVTASSAIQTSEADAFFKSGDYQKAIRSYKKLAEDNPKNTEYLFKYAEALRLSGGAAEAYAVYDEILDIDKNAVYAMEGKGLCYVNDGKFKEAVDIFSQILYKDASRWRTVNALGVVYALSGHPEESMQYYTIALEISDNNPVVLNNVGLSIALSGDTDRGVAIFKKALSRSGVSTATREKLENNLALVYGISGDMDKAEELLRKYLPEAAVYNNLGYYAKLAKDNELARTYLSKALASSPVYYEKAWKNLQGISG